MNMSAPAISSIYFQNAKRNNRGEIEQEKGTLILLDVFHIDSNKASKSVFIATSDSLCNDLTLIFPIF